MIRSSVRTTSAPRPKSQPRGGTSEQPPPCIAARARSRILAGHFEATRERCGATDDTVLILHDTTEFSYKREDIQAVGKTRIGIAGADFDGRPRHYTACGILMHSSLAVTTGRIAARAHGNQVLES